MLGKPWQVVFADGRKLEYTYSASGVKLKIKFYQGTAPQDSTDYSGTFVYRNGDLEFLTSPEGRVVKNGDDFEYQYMIGDYQGNTRVVFTSATPVPEAPLAGFEDPAADSEEYSNVPNALPYWASFTAANHTPGGAKVVRMNQGFNVGPAWSVKVYPGDKVDMEVWTYYENNSGFGTSSPSLSTLITNVALAFGGSSSAGGESGAIYDGVDQALSAFGTGGSIDDSRPGAYLNYILFDKNYNFLNMGWTAVPSSALNAQQKISIPTVNIEREGYVFVYLSYENESNLYVSFDDFKVTHTKTNILQYNEYYPFGLQTSGSWTRESASNRYLYNGGNELNGNTGWYEAFFRGYDAAIGRFMQVDPLASSFGSHSPYHFAYNNPVLFNDVLGDSSELSPDRSISSHRSGPGSGNHWSDGNQYSDWSANGGSQMFRDAYIAGAIQIGNGQYVMGKNGTLAPFVEQNGALYVRCYACGEYAGQSEDGSKQYYFNTYERVAQQGGPGDPSGWNSLLPVAVMLGGDVDIFVGGAGEFGAGGILILRGPDAGKLVGYLDYGVGLGLDLSLVAEGGVLFYTGDASKFTTDHLRGPRTEVSAAFGSVGGNVFWTPQDGDGERVIGVLGSYGPGINPLTLFGIPVPWTFNINHGATELFNSRKK